MEKRNKNRILNLCLMVLLVMIPLAAGIELYEICSDGHDNDGDGCIDCIDNDCKSDVACSCSLIEGTESNNGKLNILFIGRDMDKDKFNELTKKIIEEGFKSKEPFKTVSSDGRMNFFGMVISDAVKVEGKAMSEEVAFIKSQSTQFGLTTTSTTMIGDRGGDYTSYMYAIGAQEEQETGKAVDNEFLMNIELSSKEVQLIESIKKCSSLLSGATGKAYIVLDGKARYSSYALPRINPNNKYLVSLRDLGYSYISVRKAGKHIVEETMFTIGLLFGLSPEIGGREKVDDNKPPDIYKDRTTGRIYAQVLADTADKPAEEKKIGDVKIEAAAGDEGSGVAKISIVIDGSEPVEKEFVPTPEVETDFTIPGEITGGAVYDITGETEIDIAEKPEPSEGIPMGAITGRATGMESITGAAGNKKFTITVSDAAGQTKTHEGEIIVDKQNPEIIVSKSTGSFKAKMPEGGQILETTVVVTAKDNYEIDQATIYFKKGSGSWNKEKMNSVERLSEEERQKILGEATKAAEQFKSGTMRWQKEMYKKYMDMVEAFKQKDILVAVDSDYDSDADETTVTKKVYNNEAESLTDIVVVEEISKNVAANAKQVEVLTHYEIEVQVLNPDPIIQWKFKEVPAGEEVEIKYKVKGDKTDIIDESTQAVVLPDPEAFFEKQAQLEQPKIVKKDLINYVKLFLIALIIGYGLYMAIYSFKHKKKKNKKGMKFIGSFLISLILFSTVHPSFITVKAEEGTTGLNPDTEYIFMYGFDYPAPMEKDSIQYYIEITDKAGNYVRHGSVAEPFVISPPRCALEEEEWDKFLRDLFFSDKGETISYFEIDDKVMPAVLKRTNKFKGEEGEYALTYFLETKGKDALRFGLEMVGMVAGPLSRLNPVPHLILGILDHSVTHKQKTLPISEIADFLKTKEGGSIDLDLYPALKQDLAEWSTGVDFTEIYRLEQPLTEYRTHNNSIGEILDRIKKHEVVFFETYDEDNKKEYFMGVGKKGKYKFYRLKDPMSLSTDWYNPASLNLVYGTAYLGVVEHTDELEFDEKNAVVMGLVGQSGSIGAFKEWIQNGQPIVKETFEKIEDGRGGYREVKKEVEEATTKPMQARDDLSNFETALYIRKDWLESKAHEYEYKIREAQSLDKYQRIFNAYILLDNINSFELKKNILDIIKGKKELEYNEQNIIHFFEYYLLDEFNNKKYVPALLGLTGSTEGITLTLNKAWAVFDKLYATIKDSDQLKGKTKGQVMEYFMEEPGAITGIHKKGSQSEITPAAIEKYKLYVFLTRAAKTLGDKYYSLTFNGVKPEKPSGMLIEDFRITKLKVLTSDLLKASTGYLDNKLSLNSAEALPDLTSIETIPYQKDICKLDRLLSFVGAILPEVPTFKEKYRHGQNWWDTDKLAIDYHELKMETAQNLGLIIQEKDLKPLEGDKKRQEFALKTMPKTFEDKLLIMVYFNDLAPSALSNLLYSVQQGGANFWTSERISYANLFSGLDHYLKGSGEVARIFTDFGADAVDPINAVTGSLNHLAYLETASKMGIKVKTVSALLKTGQIASISELSKTAELTGFLVDIAHKVEKAAKPLEYASNIMHGENVGNVYISTDIIHEGKEQPPKIFYEVRYGDKVALAMLQQSDSAIATKYSETIKTRLGIGNKVEAKFSNCPDLEKGADSIKEFGKCKAKKYEDAANIELQECITRDTRESCEKALKKFRVAAMAYKFIDMENARVDRIIKVIEEALSKT